MNFDTTLAWTLFRNAPLADLAHYKQTCMHNNKTLSEVFKNNIHDLKALFEFGTTHRFFVGSILFSDEMKPYLRATLLAEKSAFEEFMNRVVQTLAANVAYDATQLDPDDPHTPLCNAFKIVTQPSVSQILNNKEIFNIIENFKLTKNITNDFCNRIFEKNNMQPLAELCDFATQRLGEPHHEKSAVKLIDRAYATLLKFMPKQIGDFIIENPLSAQEVLNEMVNTTTDSLLENNPCIKALVNTEALFRTRFPGSSSIPMREKLDQDMPDILTPKTIVETAYESYLQYIEASYKGVKCTPEEIEATKKEIREVPLETLMNDEKAKHIFDLEEILQEKIKDHIPLAQRIKEDIIRRLPSYTAICFKL